MPGREAPSSSALHPRGSSAHLLGEKKGRGARARVWEAREAAGPPAETRTRQNSGQRLASGTRSPSCLLRVSGSFLGGTRRPVSSPLWDSDHGSFRPRSLCARGPGGVERLSCLGPRPRKRVSGAGPPVLVESVLRWRRRKKFRGLVAGRQGRRAGGERKKEGIGWWLSRSELEGTMPEEGCAPAARSLGASWCSPCWR